MAAGNAPELQDLFAWYLGLFVGSVQLIFMPEGGLWITGGVAIKHLDLFQQSAFTEGIQASPAFRAERELYPLGVMKNPEHALIGAGYYAAQRLLQGAK
jgi:glucokinase